MTVLKEDTAVKMMAANMEIRLTVSVDPGYGIGKGLQYTATLYEHGEKIAQHSGSTVEQAVDFLVRFSGKLDF